MDKQKKQILFLGLVIFLIVIANLINKPSPPPPETPTVKGIQAPTKVSARIGEYYLTLSGWTSPLALVTLTSSANSLSGRVTADQNGFFLFRFVFLPNKVGELCLIAQDTNGQASPPLFLPEPVNNQNVVMENILMPPTLNLSTGIVTNEETAIASGRTFPDSRVRVYLYAQTETTLWQIIQENLVKSVFAKTAPFLDVQSDDQGDFEFNLPSAEPAEQKIFVASFLKPNLAGFKDEEPGSPKSFTLSFKSLSFWEKIAYFFGLILIQIFLWIRAIIDDPVKIIWLEIPILSFLFVKVLLRGIREKETTTNNL